VIALTRLPGIAIREARRLNQPRKHGRDLKLTQDNTRAIKSDEILLVTCLRNELVRLPFFLDYYRKLGVGHFLIVDNDSDDGFPDWIRQHEDCSVWHTAASYLASGFGMQWCNYLLGRYGDGHLCVTVDPDEFLVYPFMTTRNLRDLGLFLKDDERVSMHALLVDTYGSGTLSETTYVAGGDPFEVAPYFDRDGYVQRAGINFGTHIQGGPRMRVHNRLMPEGAPALNKIPLVWWNRNYTYASSMHDAWPPRLNRAHSPGEVSLTACLFHFKLLNLLIGKAAEEAVRKQHYDGGREYRRYRTAGDISVYEPGISVRYESPEQLIDLGLMSAGNWI
jgi:hypothetical protein